MNTFISLEFVYRSHTYYALVRKRFSRVDSHYHVTIMNSDLHSLLYGHDILVVDQRGELHTAPCKKNDEAEKLLASIKKAFQNQMETLTR